MRHHPVGGAMHPVRRRVVGSLVVSGLLMACGSEDTTAPAESAPAVSAVSPDLPAGVYAGEGVELDAWPAYLEFRDDGTGRLFLSDQSFEGGANTFDFDYGVEGSRLTIARHSLTGCASGDAAVYDWELQDPGLLLTVVEEPCPDVVRELPPRWRQLTHPLDEWPLHPGRPTVVDTSLGTIEWTTADLDQYVGNVQEVAGEFVGTSFPDIVRSTDGISWTPIPSPPDPPGLPDGVTAVVSRLAVRGDVLYASSQFGTPDPELETVYATDDWGATWRELPLEPATTDGLLNIMQIAAGDAGVIVTSRDEFAASSGRPVIGPVWVLGEAGFELVDAPFTGLEAGWLEVRAVDSGFFANERATYSPTGISGGADASWFSPDGRTWTEVVDRPQQLVVTAAVGDTVYGVAQADGVADADVISTDGGQTWSDAPERPTAVWPLPVAVGDQGFVIGSGWTPEGNSIGVVWVSADGITWERAMNLWPPVTTAVEPVWVNQDTILLIIDLPPRYLSTAVIGRIS